MDALTAISDDVRIVADWAEVLADALAAGDAAGVATAAATIGQAAWTVTLAVDPGRHVSPAITHVNGRYIPPGQL